MGFLSDLWEPTSSHDDRKRALVRRALGEAVEQFLDVHEHLDEIAEHIAGTLENEDDPF